ncbi:carbohydrate ABC transporter membrane protein 1, CUT1 family [Butyrivibrio hungatei]|uniref:Carbohydrate ABC transporter membrane protein 1, CUT1 family n=1 Tax=Butyrivibrio hungatei TaxID=185008 RepID=A0A1G5CVI0_9FIRM|nr:sugar ABC transporter permease [Butyrivibrio hungatei]SCY06412.1 carbohydrate ABC transporter membrane protein 1, CUT1 family [Butyrivibrio hungatei]
MKIKKRWYALFTAPLMITFFVVVIIPFFIGIGYSFVEWDGFAKHAASFVGMSNYKSVLGDRQFVNAAVRTTIFTVISVLTVNVLGLFFALLVTTGLKVKNFARTMLFLPYLIGGLILGYIWKSVFSEFFLSVGFGNWLTDSTKSIIAMIVVTTWQLAGYVMIVYITGIMAIPDDVMEAAAIDGANYFQTLLSIKFPLLMPSFTICLFLALSNCFKIYDVNVSLTGEGANFQSEMFSLNIYNEIFSLSNFGYGQAKAIIFFLIIAIVTFVQVSITKKREVAM